MKKITLATLTLALCSSAFAGTNMKIEGSCSGKLADGTAVSYTYYSNFDGCKKASNAAISFSSGFEGLFTGKRSFTSKSDIYNLNSGYKLRFANSTGNTSGRLTYADYSTGVKKTKTVQMQCEVRDYEYGECAN
ncbi:MAG: hypothetical protein H0V66_08375 [Bdellovibrionales bacterium]|nr:hypothetical protein [Bdellovibrionales bacterium]